MESTLSETTGKQELRIVLVGKTGVVKSASGNTILRRKAFQCNPSATTECQRENGEYEGQTLAVVDTPGLWNTRLTEEQVMVEIRRCSQFAYPGPHAILIVLQGGRFNKAEDQQIVESIQQILGQQSSHYTMVLFTCEDDLKVDGDTIEDIIRRDKALSDFICQCHGGYHVFNNREKDPSQVRELMKKIKTMVQSNGGRHYSTEIFRESESEKNRREEKKETQRKHKHKNKHLGQRSNQEAAKRVLQKGNSGCLIV